ncbi:MAG: phosphate acyltransferase [Bacteroidales bacterium]
MRIGIDIMGGDYAPGATLSGAVLALSEMPAHIDFALIGDRSLIEDYLTENRIPRDRLHIVHASEVVEMGDHPAKALTQKPDSSMAVGFRMLRKGEIDGFCSAGNTGAVLVGASIAIKSIPGLIRPAIGTILPSLDGPGNVILDIGINPDCRPDVLYQYGIIGSLYAKYVTGIEKPRVGLLNIGSEETKGNLVSRSAYELMNGSTDFLFVGNVEGNDLFSNKKMDVVVCEGFVGNIVLKEAETLYTIVRKRNIQDPFLEKFNYENYGGTPILGINAPVVIGHGMSNPVAIKNMLKHTMEVVEAGLCEKIKEAFNNG